MHQRLARAAVEGIPLTLRVREPRAGEHAPVLTGLFFDGDRRAEGPLESARGALFSRFARELAEYLRGERRAFGFAWAIEEGTPFQREVWRALEAIPYGETRRYAELAQTIGRPRAVRAVGAANARNPMSIVVPCHRVVGADGSLTGYAGGLALKARLLALEAASSSSARAARTGGAPRASASRAW